MKKVLFPNHKILHIPTRHQQPLLQLGLIKRILKPLSIFPDIIPNRDRPAPCELGLRVLRIFQESAKPARILMISQELEIFGVELETEWELLGQLVDAVQELDEDGRTLGFVRIAEMAASFLELVTEGDEVLFD